MMFYRLIYEWGPIGNVRVARVGILVAGIILVGKVMGVQAACVRGGVGCDSLRIVDRLDYVCVYRLELKLLKL